MDVTGPHLYTIYPHGSTDKLPYVTMGSGSLAAMSVFESGFKKDMERGEAEQLVRQAIRAGIFNDLGSGSNVDICVITKDKVDYLRPFDEANKRRSPGQLSLQEGNHRRFKGDRQTNSLRSCLGNGRRHGHFVILFRGDPYPTLIHVYVIRLTDF